MKKVTSGVLALLLSTTSLHSAALLPNGQQQFVDGNGKPYASGSVYFYSNYPTCSVLKNTWSNSGQTVLNTNPVVLDSAGRATIFGSGSYCQVLKDSSNNTIWTKETSDPSGTSNLGWGGTSGGTANAQTVTVSGFSSTNGQTFYFVAGYTNTSSMTMSVNGGTAISVLKDTPTGSQFLTGGEVVAGNVTGLTYVSSTGTFHLITNTTTTPSGQVSAFAMNSCPGGWVEADGSALSRATYANLFTNIGTSWGSGDGSTTFNLPDFRGEFLRGWDHSRGVDSVAITGVTTNTSTTISGLASTSALYVGQPVSGPGIPSGATIATIGPAAGTITISAAATATSTVLNGTTASSTTITGISSTASLSVGQTVTGTGIPAGTVITAIYNSTTINISQAATGSATVSLTFASPLTFTGRAFASYEADSYLTHNHGITDPQHNHSITSIAASGSFAAGGQLVPSGSTTTGNAVTNVTVNNSSTGNVETRPKNYAVLYCVKY